MSSFAVAASLASGGVESLDWLNDLVAQLWSYINVAGASIVKESVEPSFQGLPGPLSSLHFLKIDLGMVPIRFDNIDVHTKNEGIIKLDLDINWDGECDIQLKANVIGQFGVKSIKLRGRFSVVLCPLIERVPIVSAVQIGFINPPEIEIDFTGMASVAEFGFIDQTIKQTLHNVLKGLLVLPNRMLVKLDPENNYLETFQPPLGVVRVTAVKGQDFKVQGRMLNRDVPDVYCKISFAANDVWKTSTNKNSTNPEWNESMDFLLSDQDQIIVVDAFDDDGLSGDDDIGVGKVSVGEILLEGGTKDVLLTKNESDTGASVTIQCTIYRFTPSLTSFCKEEHRGKESICGLLTVLVLEAHDIPVAKEDANSFVKVEYKSTEFNTPKVAHATGIDALNPIYDAPFLVQLTQDMMEEPGSIVLTLMNGETAIGSTEVTHSELVDSTDQSITEKRHVGEEGASIEFSVALHGVHSPE